MSRSGRDGFGADRPARPGLAAARRRRRAWRLLALASAAAFLAGELLGCAGSPSGTPARNGRRPAGATAPGSGAQAAPGPRPAGRPLKGTDKPYVINGQTYEPVLSADGWVETGTASWYGPAFHGRQTSCGETYDMYQMTAAHKLLPMHTQLQVTNLDNGRQCLVRVNDRGPFVPGRILDLSYSAALALGVVQNGTARVQVETVGGIPGARDGELPGVFYVQVGAFQVRANAENLRAQVASAGYAGSRITQGLVDGQEYWRVQAGSFASLSQAKEAHARLISRYPASFLVAD